MKSGVLFILGVVILAFGVLFALQGAGAVPWPRESFMVNDRGWIENGIVVAMIGIACILAAWRIRKTP